MVNKLKFFALMLFLTSSIAELHAECVTDSFGRMVYSRAGGTLAKDMFGLDVCGLGQCVKNFSGALVCAKEAGGAAAIDSWNIPVCAGGCAPADAKYCTTLK